MSTGQETKENGSLMVWSSKTHTVIEKLRLPESTPVLVGDVIPVDPAVSRACLLASDLWCHGEKTQGEGAVYLLDKSMRVNGIIHAEAGESMFGSRLAASTVQDGEQFLAVQLTVRDAPSDEHPGREWFAIYSLKTQHRQGIIKGSSQYTGFRHSSVVCTWVPDCDRDGVQDLAIDLRDRVVLYSGKDLLPIRLLTYAKQLTRDHYFGRSLTCVHLASGSDQLVLGIPGWFAEPKSSFLMCWPLATESEPRRVGDPGCGDGFGTALCQTRNGDCFATGMGPFDTCLSYAKREDPVRFSTILTESWMSVMIGSAIRCVGDFDGDGAEDVAVTRFNREADGCPGQGVVLVSGKTLSVIGQIELNDKHRYVWH